MAIFLAFVMVFGGAPLGALAGHFGGFNFSAQAARKWQAGDIGTFGSYPQTAVTDSSLLSALNAKTLNWVSYGYYSGNRDEGSMTQSDYMKYADVTHGGSKYRAVKFTSYRPDGTFGESSASNSYQDENGYYTNTTYWFKYEPLRWRVLDPSSGLVMCESIIDSQAYSNTIYYKPGEYYNNPACTVYANDYATSSMRTWLNGPFLQTAFTSSEQSVVKTTALDNSAYPGYPQYNSASTNDKLFLLSYSESTNAAYGFSADNWDDDHPARYAQGSDYAKSQGLWVNNSPGSDYDKNSEWFLRSPGGYYCNVSNVYYDGNVYFNYLVYNTHFGVRPAFKISNPASLKSASSGSAQASPSASSAAPIFEEEADITPAYSNEAQASPSASSAAPTFEKEAERSPMAAAIIIATGVVIFAAVGIGFFVYWRKK